jgi:hypothetical protein
MVYTYHEETGYERPMRSRKLSTALREAEEILRDGEWGQGADDFAGVTVEANILDSDGVSVDGVTVDILPPEPRCDGRRRHDWVETVEIDGGCRENPGVMSTGGTSFEFRSHCSRCGIQRVERTSGDQRNPDQPRHTVRYIVDICAGLTANCSDYDVE